MGNKNKKTKKFKINKLFIQAGIYLRKLFNDLNKIDFSEIGHSNYFINQSG